MMQLNDYRLNVYLFASLTDEGAADGVTGMLGDTYAALASGLGLNDEVENLSSALPPTLDSADGIVAGRRDKGPNTREILFIVEDDVACLCVTLSRGDLTNAGWLDLASEWPAAATHSATSALIGVAFVYQALANTNIGDVTDTDLLMAIRTQLPVAPARGWERTSVGLRPATATAGGEPALALWQIDPIHSAGVTQHMVVIGGAQADNDLGERVWTGSWRGGHLPAIPRYLLEAAKLRYQARVLVRDQGSLRQQRRTVGQTLDQLRPVLTAPADASNEDLLDAQERLAQLQADEAGLINALAAARAMRRAVVIAEANMAAVHADVAHHSDRDSGASLFDQYQTDAHILEQRLDDEALFLQAASERAQFFSSAADRELARRADRDVEKDRRQQERFSLTQTAFLGAVVMALTAVQAFDYVLPVPQPAKPAWIATLGALAFWLAAIAIRLAKQGRQPGGRRPHDLLEIAACALFGATVGWAATVTLASPDTLVTLLSAAAGAALGVLISAVARRHARGRVARASGQSDRGTR